MLEKLIAALPLAITVEELHTPQNTGKLRFKHTSLHTLEFTIFRQSTGLPTDDYDSFFGNMYNYSASEIRS